MSFYCVRFIGRTVFVLRQCFELFGIWFIECTVCTTSMSLLWFIGRTIFVLRWCPKLLEFLVFRAYRFCTTPLHRLNFLLFLTFPTSFIYGNALGIPVFILEPGNIVEIEVSPDFLLTLSCTLWWTSYFKFSFVLICFHGCYFLFSS